jgi:glycosyltransferase involved in cell wall biosynthesis
MTAADVSILMPSYGYGRFLSDALDSALEQSGIDVQVIVQDACSNDGSVDVLKGYGSAISWRSEPDDGQSDALNRALERATGEWVGWLNADEFYLPGTLKHLMAVARREQADVVYGDAVFVDEDGRVLRLLPQHRLSPLVIESYGTFISTCATLFRREALPDRPWDPSLKRVMDWDVYLKLLASGCKFVHTPHPIAAFRVHSDQVTAARDEAAFNEYRTVRARYGINQTRLRRSAAYATHALLKLGSGSYTRQLKVNREKGRSLEWGSKSGIGAGLRGVFDAYGSEVPLRQIESVD